MSRPARTTTVTRSPRDGWRRHTGFLTLVVALAAVASGCFTGERPTLAETTMLGAPVGDPASAASARAAEVGRASARVDAVAPTGSAVIADDAVRASAARSAVRSAMHSGLRPDVGAEFGAEGVGGSAPLWPEWVTCSFDDGRTEQPGVRSVVIDRDRQRSWFCEGAEAVRVFPVTTARSQPDPGVYEVYAKDMHTSSTFGGAYSTMTHFVAFTHGKFQGARVAFHSVPVYPGGAWVQPLDTVGSLDRHGDSSGCIRALPADAEAIWDWLDIGDVVRVVT